MALSGVNQSHVQPVWAEIPSLSENISAEERIAVQAKIILRDLASLTIAIVDNLFRLPSPDIQVVMDVNVQAPR